MAVKNGGDGMRKGNGGQDDEDRARLVKKRSPNEEVRLGRIHLIQRSPSLLTWRGVGGKGL